MGEISTEILILLPVGCADNLAVPFQFQADVAAVDGVGVGGFKLDDDTDVDVPYVRVDRKQAMQAVWGQRDPVIGDVV